MRGCLCPAPACQGHQCCRRSLPAESLTALSPLGPKTPERGQKEPIPAFDDKREGGNRSNSGQCAQGPAAQGTLAWPLPQLPNHNQQPSEWPAIPSTSGFWKTRDGVTC